MAVYRCSNCNRLFISSKLVSWYGDSKKHRKCFDCMRKLGEHIF
jgi:DNA-directed RNA polymerase subunit RPC12/RpoP